MRLAAGASVVFRADASLAIGTGHVMRCLTLAAALRERGAICRFVTRAHPGNLADTIRAWGFGCMLLPIEEPAVSSVPSLTAHDAWLGSDMPTDAARTADVLHVSPVDWLIVDHYALDAAWELLLRPHAARILAIDDLADRRHDCDLLLDQNLGRQATDYAALVPPGCPLCLGPAYALLRPEFAAWRERSLARRELALPVHLLVTMGGVDRGNVSGAVLDALLRCSLSPEARISVVLGDAAPALIALREQAAAMPWLTEVLVGVDDMARLMCEADLAIGAAGGTAWERCCVGLPSLLVVLADNQRQGAQALALAGAAVLLGRPDAFADRLPLAISEFAQPAALANIARRCSGVTDGQGVARVMAEMVAIDG